MTLFDDQRAGSAVAAGGGESAVGTPLAERMRPRSLDEMVGQVAVVGEGAFLRRALAEGRVPSLVFWGPPGTGKTTLALILARDSDLEFVPFSAVTAGIKEVKAVMADAQRLRRSQGRRTMVFVDEIHRFNKAQQDAFLPYVERGDILLVGATTENPSFELNSALLSRCRVVVLEPLAVAELTALAERALADREHGLGGLGVEAVPEALASIAQLASGDARTALNLLEAAAADAARGDRRIDPATVARVAQRKVLRYDKAGEEHFNLISALHKSVRESDPDAALYWLARMLAAGEDPHYLARRLVRMANEDVGLADPEAVRHALAGWDAYHRLGTPEGELALAQVALYLALAPKSNAAYAAWGAARRAVEERPAEPVPMAIRNAPTRLMQDLGYGEGYVYAHDTEEGVGGIDCLPEAIQGSRFYQPRGAGAEAELGDRLERFRALREAAKKKRRG
jgi:putative ATPase